MKVKFYSIRGDDLIDEGEADISLNVLSTCSIIRKGDKYFSFWRFGDQPNTLLYMGCGGVFTLVEENKNNSSPFPIRIYSIEEVSAVEWSDGVETRIDFRNYRRPPQTREDMVAAHRRQRFPESTG